VKGDSSISYLTRNQDIDIETTDLGWINLYRVGGIAAIVVAVLIVTSVITFVVWPPPPPEASVTDWFAIFQRNPLAAMRHLDLMMLASLASNVALIPTLLAVVMALRRTSQTLVALAATFGLIGIATYFASSRVFEMLALSQQYASATSEAQRAALIAAGQSMLTTYLGAFATPMPSASWNYQGTAFNVSFVFLSVACLMLAVVMLRSKHFGRLIGTLGIIGNVVEFGFFAPVVGVYLSLVGLVVLLIWHVLIAWALWLLARRTSAMAERHQHTDPVIPPLWRLSD